MVAASLAWSCGSNCGLALHDRVPVTANAPRVPCCGGSAFADVNLAATDGGDAEFDLASSAVLATQQGTFDAFLVPTSCASLFDGPYPGGAPLCRVYLGPVAPGAVSGRVPLPAGTYRVWVQSATSNATELTYGVDVGVWDHNCKRTPLQ
jgi:hypothetical protein